MLVVEVVIRVHCDGPTNAPRPDRLDCMAGLNLRGKSERALRQSIAERGWVQDGVHWRCPSCAEIYQNNYKE